MSRRRRVALVCAAGLAAGLIAHFVAPDTPAAALCLLGACIVLGELLVLRLEDGSAIPLSYAVVLVVASSFDLRDFVAVVVGAEVASIVLRVTTDRTNRWRIAIFVERLAVAAATFAAYTLAAHRFVDPADETVATVLGALAIAAIAQMAVDVAVRRLLNLGTTFAPRGRLAWLAISSSGILMAIGYRGVGGSGKVGIWGPLLFATPLLAAWYAFERLDSATRSYRQTIEALAMAPEFGGMVPAGHAERVAVLASRMGDELGLSNGEIEDLEMAALLHHLGQVTLDEPEDDEHGFDHAEIARVTGAMLRDIRPLESAGQIVAGESDDPKQRMMIQVLRIASEYDDLTVRDNTPGDLALESLRSAPAYVYDDKVVVALERVLRDLLGAS